MPTSPIPFEELNVQKYENLNFYERLGLDLNEGSSEEALVKAIKSAYRARAPLYHPDRNPGEKEKANAIFNALQEAYDRLSDPDKRVIYNSTLTPRSHEFKSAPPEEKSKERHHSDRTFEDESDERFYNPHRNLFDLPGVYFDYKINNSSPIFSYSERYFSRVWNDYPKEQVDFINSLTREQVDFLNRDDMKLYVKHYKQIKLALKLTPEIIAKIPVTWLGRCNGVIDLIAQGYGIENFLAYSVSELRRFNNDHFQALLNELTIKEILKMHEDVLCYYNRFPNLLSREQFIKMESEMSVNNIFKIIDCYPLLLQYINNELTSAQIAQMTSEIAIKWNEIPWHFKQYVLGLKQHATSLAETISRYIARFYNRPIHQSDFYKLYSLQEYLYELQAFKVLKDAKEVFYQEILVKNYFRSSDKKIDLEKALENTPNFESLSALEFNDHIFRLRKELLDAIIKMILETEWISGLQESKTVTSIGKALPPRVETIFNSLKAAAELPSKHPKVTELLTSAQQEAKLLKEEKAPASVTNLHDCISLMEPVSKYIEKQRQKIQTDAADAEAKIAQAKTDKAKDVCFMLTCACYCPLQYTVTCLNLLFNDNYVCNDHNSDSWPEIGKTNGWVYYDPPGAKGYYGEPIVGPGAACFRFFCAPRENIKRARSDFEAQNKKIESLVPVTQRMI